MRWAIVLATLACGQSSTSRPAIDAGASGSYPVGSAPRAVATGDVDGDGDLDVVVAESGAARAALLLNDGRGGLVPGAMPSSGPMPSDVRLVDVDGDGDLDVALPNHETSDVTVLRNDGHAGFTATTLATGSRPHVHGVAAADLDGDGAIDLALDSADDDTVRVLFGSAAPARAIHACPLPYYKLGAGDVSGDGVADLLVPCQRSRSLVVLGASGPGMLARAADVPLPEQPWVAIAGDLDGDGRAEIVLVLETSVAVLRGDVASGFVAVPGSPFSVPGATEIAIGDLDGDGAGDLAVGAWDASQVVVFLGRSFARRTLPSGRRPVGLAIADLDGDGRGELVAASLLDNEVSILRLPR